MSSGFTLLINTASRQGGDILAEIKSQLISAGIKIDAIMIAANQTELKSAIENLQANPPARLLIGGGDGTIVSLIEKLHHLTLDIGVLPLGTTNNFAHNLEVGDIATSIATIKSNKPQSLWLGQCNDKIFLNVASIGISANVAHDVPNWLKRATGRGAYILTGMVWFLKHRPFKASIIVDNKTTQVNTHQIIIANGKYHGSLPISGLISVKREQLAVLVIGRGTNRLRHLIGLIYFASNKAQASSTNILLHGRKIQISTAPVKFAETDGEITLKSPLDIGLVQTICRFYLP